VTAPSDLGKPARGVSRRRIAKRKATHVDAYAEALPDAGSIPAASTINPLFSATYDEGVLLLYTRRLGRPCAHVTRFIVGSYANGPEGGLAALCSFYALLMLRAGLPAPCDSAYFMLRAEIFDRPSPRFLSYMQNGNRSRNRSPEEASLFSKKRIRIRVDIPLRGEKEV